MNIVQPQTRAEIILSDFVWNFHVEEERAIRVHKMREGQAKMYALLQTAPDLYDVVEGTEADCYNDDALIPNFREVVFGR